MAEKTSQTSQTPAQLPAQLWRAATPATQRTHANEAAMPLGRGRMPLSLRQTSIFSSLAAGQNKITAHATAAPGPVPRKYKIIAEDDPLEYAADRAAARTLNSTRQLQGSAHDRAALHATQHRASNNDASPAIAASVQQTLHSPGRHLEPPLRTEFETRFGRSLSAVRIHTDAHASESARVLRAQAYTAGSHIAFAAGQYAPGTSQGRSLLAHELAHTVQHQEGRVASDSILCRRVPGAGGLDTALAASGPNFDAGREGAARILHRAWESLNGAQRTAVRTAVVPVLLSWTSDADLLTQLNAATRDQLLAFAQAVRTEVPDRELGDPLLIDVGARPATADAANITTLVNGANTILDDIAAGTHDASIEQIFGAANVATAKGKYHNARVRINHLHANDHIVTDRSGYSAEVSLGGLSNSAQIALSPDTIDNPTDDESVITLIHEGMHAGNNDIDDFGYIDQPSFTALAETVKLVNAAHFEVVPRRILGASFAFAGQTFVPAGTTVGGVTAPPLTQRQRAIRDASETFRDAWTVGLNLHSLYVRLFRTPAEWNTLDLATEFNGAASGARFSNTLPFWSKVEKLTIHTRRSTAMSPHTVAAGETLSGIARGEGLRLPELTATNPQITNPNLIHPGDIVNAPTGGVNPASASPAERPVTLIDISLSEGVTRKLAQGMINVPQTETDAQTFETAHATAAERSAAQASANAERDLLMRLVIRVHTNQITGPLDRDMRAVQRMAQASRAVDFTDYMQIRSPADFAD